MKISDTRKRWQIIYHTSKIYLFIDEIQEIEKWKKNNQRKYIQVTYALNSEEVVSREYGNLKKIKDNWPQIVISLDDLQLKSKSGISHIQAWNLDEV